MKVIFFVIANTLPSPSTNWVAGQVFFFLLSFPFFFTFMSNPLLASDSGLCNCEQRSRK